MLYLRKTNELGVRYLVAVDEGADAEESDVLGILATLKVVAEGQKFYSVSVGEDSCDFLGIAMTNLSDDAIIAQLMAPLKTHYQKCLTLVAPNLQLPKGDAEVLSEKRDAEFADADRRFMEDMKVDHPWPSDSEVADGEQADEEYKSTMRDDPSWVAENEPEKAHLL
jgi:hypothetical protein